MLNFTTSTQSHGTHVISAGDLGDWFSFSVTAGETYHLVDNGSAGDAMIQIYSDMGITLVGSDDNSGGGSHFNAVYTASSSGTWYAKVSDVSGAGWVGSLDYFKVSGPTATVTPVISAVDGPLEFEDHHFWPNPAMGGYVDLARIAVKLKGSADSLTVKVYTRAMLCVGTQKLGPQSAGWHHLPLPSDFVQDASNGTYYYVVSGERGQAKTVHNAVGKLTIIR